MHFVKLSYKVLLVLEKMGYTILRSVNSVDDENPTWIPEKVYDIFSYTLKMDCEMALIVISDALKHIDPKDLIGDVLINSID